jgi:hypothetical protein
MAELSAIRTFQLETSGKPVIRQLLQEGRSAGIPVTEEES